MKKILFLSLLYATQAFAQSSAQMQRDQFDKQVEEIMKARAEMLDSLMDDSGDLEKKMLEMMKRMSGQGAGLGLGLDEFNSPVVGQYDWLESATHRTLKLQVKQIKDHPLDIKIEQGMIKIKGDLETIQGEGKNKTVSKTHFERTFGIPDDVDQTNPEFLNLEGEIHIKFKKLAGKTQVKDKETQVKKPTESSQKVAPKIDKSDRVPVTPGSDEISI